MTAEIKELVKRLRDGFITMECEDDVVRYTNHVAADALEAMAGEVERLKDRLRIANGVLAETTQKALELQTERDRLKAAITTHVAGCVACGGSGVVFLCPERDDTAEAVREDCEECVGLRKALGGGA